MGSHRIDKRVFAIPTTGPEMEKAAKRSDEIVDLLQKAGIAPDRITMAALLMIVTNHQEVLEEAADLPADVAKAVEEMRGDGKSGLIEAAALPEAVKSVGDLSEFLNNPPRRGAVKVDKDGIPMFMAPPSKTVN